MNIEGKPYPTNCELSGKGTCCKKDALVTIEKINYEEFFWNRLKIICTAQFSFGGINNKYMRRSNISLMQYNYGNVCFFIDDILNVLMALPCEILAWGIGGIPTQVRVFSPYVEAYEKVLDARNDEFFVCFDTETMISPKLFFIPWIIEMAEISVTMRVNTIGLRAPIIAVSSVHEKLAMENVLQQFLDGKYLIELKDNEMKKRDGSMDDNDISKRLKTLNIAPEYYLDKLDTQRNAIWNKLMETLGFKVNTAPAKKERAITGEVEGNKEETMAFYNARKNPRLDALEWMHEHGFEKSTLIETTKMEEITLGDIDKELERGEGNA